MNLVFNNWALMIVVVGRQENKPRLSITDIGKKMDCTYSNLASMTYELEKRGLIKREKKGRRVIISLEEKGRTIYESLEKIIEITSIKNYQGIVIDKWRIKIPAEKN